MVSMAAVAFCSPQALPVRAFRRRTPRCRFRTDWPVFNNAGAVCSSANVASYPSGLLPGDLWQAGSGQGHLHSVAYRAMQIVAHHLDMQAQIIELIGIGQGYGDISDFIFNRIQLPEMFLDPQG